VQVILYVPLNTTEIKPVYHSESIHGNPCYRRL